MRFCFVTFLLLFLNCCFGDDIYRNISLEADKPQHVVLLPSSVTMFVLNLTALDARYVVFNIHSQYKNLTVSSAQSFEQESSTTPGSDRGVVTLLTPYDTTASWYVSSNSSRNVSVMAIASTYTRQDPLVGGCNQEFNMENNANIHLSYDAHNTILQFQYSNTGDLPDCEADVSWNNLTYDLYLYYLQENNLSEDMFFHGLQRMLNVGAVMSYGTKIVPSFQRSNHHSNFTIASYLGRGAIYAVVVTETRSQRVSRAMYVAAATYACEFEGKVDSCEARHNVAGWVLCTFAGVVGIFICFLGHRFFKTEMFLWGFAAFTLIFFIVFTLHTTLDFTARMLIASAFGVVGGGLWLALWWFGGIAVLSVLLGGMNLGYLFSSIMFFTPFGNLDVWKNDFNYGMTFACGVLLVPVFLLYFTRLLNILACTVIGSYSFVVAINAYLRGSLSYIVVNSVRRAVNEEFNRSVMVAPFQLSEIILCIVWGALAIGGTAFQLYREKGRPEFPECPHKVDRKNRLTFLRANARANAGSERAPLLVNADDIVGRRDGYGTSQSPEVM